LERAGGLRELGWEDEAIEADFLPAMALRNEIDVAASIYPSSHRAN
jgi:hypothetical protein